jgi:hypothetical protein
MEDVDQAFRDRCPIPVLLEGEQYRTIYSNVNACWLIALNRSCNSWLIGRCAGWEM